MIKPFAKPVYVTQPYLPPLDEVVAELQKIWDAGWLTNNGPKHQELERVLSRVLEAEHLSLFNNGMTALMIGLRALELKGEVITTPFTFAATPNALVWNNLEPVFVDVDPVNLTFRSDKIAAAITPRTSAILGVHVFGNLCDVKSISAIAQKHNLHVIYDAAHAFQSKLDGRAIASFGDMSMFSFHATKLFHTIEGGGLAVNTADLKQRIDYLKNFGIKSEAEIIAPGINGKMNEVQAAVGLVVARHLPEERERRQQVKRWYLERLSGVAGLTVVTADVSDDNSHQYFVIRINADQFGATRDDVYEKLKTFQVFARKYFFPLCSTFPQFSDLPSSRRRNLPESSAAVTEVLSLPYSGYLTEEDVDRICAMIISFRRT